MTLYLNGTTGISGVDGSAGTPAVQGTDTNTGISFPAADTIAFNEGGVEVGRFDSSGRLLVGTSTARANFFNSTDTALIQVEGANNNAQRYSGHIYGVAGAGGPWHIFAKHRSNSLGGTTVVTSDDQIGAISFQGADGTEFVEGARIEALVDGTPGANDMPGRLVFSTTADGASSPTERMRLDSAGRLLFAKTSTTVTDSGVQLGADGSGGFAVSGAPALYVSRNTNDGDLVRFFQDAAQEGQISVSGTTVTYGGGHLGRWSQLPNNGDPSEILKGTVISNLDEMCEWSDEDNEQLNKTKVSDVDDDPNVAGVFVSVSPSDDGPLDFFVGMTGDMIIRIAEGVTVQRGDLLVSAGDGTARPQGDRYIKDSTVAKVTSTNVTCTYEDGSYCVPCVLMAC